MCASTGEASLLTFKGSNHIQNYSSRTRAQTFRLSNSTSELCFLQNCQNLDLQKALKERKGTRQRKKLELLQHIDNNFKTKNKTTKK